MTCTDQPGDQIIGAISAGPDGTPGTTDDIASWLLGRDVTDSVRGARWVAAAPLPSTPARPERGPNPAARREPAPPGTRPVQSRPAAGAKTKQNKFIKVMDLDENGLPIIR